MNQMNFPDSDFWNYSVQLFQIPEVESQCLSLQDDYNADVNVLLCCCWAAEQAIELNTDDIQSLVETSRPWQTTIIGPIRDTRRLMKQNVMAMPSKMSDDTLDKLREMELNAEHMAQLALEKAIREHQQPATDDISAVECATRNSLRYLQQLDSDADINNATQHLSALLEAIYQDSESIQVALMTSID